MKDRRLKMIYSLMWFCHSILLLLEFWWGGEVFYENCTIELCFVTWCPIYGIPGNKISRMVLPFSTFVWHEMATYAQWLKPATSCLHAQAAFYCTILWPFHIYTSLILKYFIWNSRWNVFEKLGIYVLSVHI